jgi:hypothetical protein
LSLNSAMVDLFINLFILYIMIFLFTAYEIIKNKSITDHLMVIPSTELKDERIGFGHFCYLYLRKT